MVWINVFQDLVLVNPTTSCHVVIDTQPTGGKYDGVLGVLSGLEIIRTLNDLDIKQIDQLCW